MHRRRQKSTAATRDRVAGIARSTRDAAGDLVEEAVDDHDVLLHYPGAVDLAEDVADSMLRLRAREPRIPAQKAAPARGHSLDKTRFVLV